ncbi:glycoside hydrolase superfamily [Mucidula mucida]|nr:glycoside hydrolase superfamily [Mucidula mucida]
MSSNDQLTSAPYQQQPAHSGMSYALEKSQKRNARAKWIAIGSITALLILIAIGVGVGVGVSKANKNNNNNSAASSSSGTGSSDTDSPTQDGPGGTTQTDPNDPSSFTKDSRLHKSLYGIAYTPVGSIMPDCGSELKDIITDIQLMSQLTNRLRLYGSDCNQSALVLEAIKQTKVDMKVYLGNYPDISDDTVYSRQRDAIKEALQTYGRDHVAGITVGNEFILNYVTDNGGDPNDATVTYIDDTRSMLKDLGMDDMEVGNSDAGYYFNDLVLEAVDYGLANVHPWFADVTIDQAPQWTFDSFDEENVQHAATLPNKVPQMYIAETGWPSQANDTLHESNGASDASEANLQSFLDNFVCKANTDNVGYFYFEFFDEKWKDEMYGGVEGYWGLFHQNRTLKNIQIPDCAAP